MFTHLLKMIWNRKRTNGLIIAEVAIAFVIIFAVAVLCLRNYSLYHIPLGFHYDNMWRLHVLKSGAWDKKTDAESFQQIIRAVKQLPEVEHVNLLRNPAFKNWSSVRTVEANGQYLSYYLNSFDDTAGENFGMTLLDGRWFSPQDSNQLYEALLVNQVFVDKYYPNQDVLGKDIASLEDEDPEEERREQRIVGVFEEFRQFGELSPVMPYVFYRIDAQQPNSNVGIEITLKSNTDPIFEQRLVNMLNQMAPEFSFSFTAWRNNRDSQLRETLVPLSIFAVVAVFLILMVAMGLFGVLWQNVTTRTSEIGLRRALGATANKIHAQIMIELVIVILIGVLIAFIGLIQLPMLGVFQELDWSLFWLSFFSSLSFMLTLAIACAFYPGRVATGFTPSEALHYE